MLSHAPRIAGATQDEAVTFNRHIAPIIHTRCAPCHRPGDVAPFPLLSYEDVQVRARQIAQVTRARSMPPWKPEPGYGEFIGARRLSDEQVALIERWAAEGALEGDPADRPLTPTWPSGWRLGRPDLVVRMSEPFVVPPDGNDVFRVFVLPIPTSAPRYVKGLEFRPGNPRVVHHANMGVDSTRSSRRLDAREAGPGYSGGMLPAAQHPEGHFLGWTPGRAPQMPAGMSWRLEPASDLVVQLHMQPTGEPESVQAEVGLFFTDDAPPALPTALRLGKQTIDIPAGRRRHVIEDSYVLPVDVDLYGVQPHAHNLGREMRAYATLPDGTRVWLIYITDWDFKWQDVYRYRTPLSLPKGSRVTMVFTYDNSAENPRNPHRPPRRVRWGQNTTDEMGDLWLQVIPRRADELEVLRRDVQAKTLTEDIAGYERLLEVEPHRAEHREALGVLYLAAGRNAEAEMQLRAALRADPGWAHTHYNLGIALFALGRAAAAETAFREAVRLDPEHADAHNNLGGVLQTQGQVDEAVQQYRRALELRPDTADAHGNLAGLLTAIGRPEEAIEHFRRAVELRPAWTEPTARLAWILATTQPALGDPSEAIALAERAVGLADGVQPTLLDVLAAAYAAGGQFERAAATAEEALRYAEGGGAPSQLVDAVRSRLELYRRGEPYLEARPGTPLRER